MLIRDIIEAKREKVQAIAKALKAELGKVQAIAKALKAELGKVQAVAKKLKAELREKYLESLSEEDREGVLKRERERERERKKKLGKKRTILDIANEEAEEVEEVFPWEETSNS